MPSADLPTRLAEAAGRIIAEHDPSTFIPYRHTAEAVVNAILRILADAPEESVWQEALRLYSEAYERGQGTPRESRLAGLRAAAPLLLAAERALVAGLSQTIGEVEAERATLRRQLEEARDLLAELTDERPCELYGTAGKYCMAHHEKLRADGCPHALAQAFLAAAGRGEGRG